MQATAVLPVKRFGAAKRRLGDAAGSGRPALAEAMLSDVLDALARSERVRRVIVVSGEPAARAEAVERGVEWIDDPDDAGHPQAARLGVAAALEAGDACAALLPGDCPLLDPVELDRAIGALRAGVVGIVPDRHGSGTNGLLLAPPDAIAPAFGPGSRERHLELARRSGVEPRIFAIDSLALDLDTPDDLAELSGILLDAPERAPATARFLTALSTSPGPDA
jgi:2-phospho-L-lactate/phosphoenolpyruvate guanylyltransferase